MRTIILFIFVLFLSRSGFSQIKIASADPGKELTDSTASMKLFGYHDGRYCFRYQNVLSQKPDPITIIFKDRTEANSFIKEVKKAFVLREGSMNKVNYGNSQISLIPASNGSVFMRVGTKGAKVSAFEINRFTFQQINILQ
jgi:hypothetical protein